MFKIHEIRILNRWRRRIEHLNQETGTGRLKTRNWTSRDLTTRHQIKHKCTFLCCMEYYMNVIYRIYHFVFFVICACILLLLLQKSIHFNLIETAQKISCRRRLLLQLAPLLIRTPLMSLLARAPDWRRPRRRPRCCCCCRSAAVVCPYARRQNAAPLAETAGDCKSHWWTLLYTTWFSCRLACSISFLVDGCSTRCEDERRHSADQ